MLSQGIGFFMTYSGETPLPLWPPTTRRCVRECRPDSFRLRPRRECDFFQGVNVKSAVTIRHIFVSSGHNFYGRHGQPAGEFATNDVPFVKCRAGWGLEGDRFYGYRPDYNGQITFFSWETYEGIKRGLGVSALRPEAFRRNVLVEGAHLNSLIGSRFSLGGIDFQGMCESKPCHWMNEAVAPGAEEWLRGHGGLRAKILTDGVLRCGPSELYAGDLLAFN